MRQCSEYSEKPRCPHRSIYFLYSDLTDAVTCWPTHTSSTGGRSSRNRICFNQLFYTAISTSLTPERGPCRKPSGGGSGRYPLLQKALRFIGGRFVDGNTFPAIAVGRLEWGRVELPILGWKRSETEQNRPLACNLGRFGGLSCPFLRLIAQTMRRRLTLDRV